MSPLVIAEGKKIGETTADLPFGFQAWRPNDGLVSVPSAQYPVGHKYAMMDPADRKLQPKGVWDAHPVISGPDHLSIVIPDGKQTALDPGKTGLLNLYQFYLQIANDLVRLPQ